MTRIRRMIALWICREYIHALDTRERFIEAEVSGRVAEFISKMDPWEPLMRKYNVVFSEDYQHAEDKLNEQGRLGLFMWAHTQENDIHFKHVIDFLRNTQGNATLRKASHPDEWLYGRAAIATLTLLVREIGRLSSHYKDIMARRDIDYDRHLPVE